MHGGVVQEAIEAAGYTYIRVKLDSGDEQWAAASKTKIVVGDRVNMRISMRMSNFHSKGLSRTFPSIWFVYVEGAPAGGGPIESDAATDLDTI